MAVQDIPSSYATQSTTGIASVSASATATNKPTQYHQQSPPSPQPDLDPNLNPIEKTSPQDSQHAPSNRQQDPHKDDISYWSALYLVCCPCKRKKLRRSAPKLPQEQYNWPVYPGKAPTSPYPVDYWRPTSPTAYSRAQAQHHAQLYPMETRASGPVYELPALNLDHSAQHGNPVYGGLEVNYHLGIEVRDVDALVGDWTTIYEIRGTD
ncbi:uncharacterized protein N7511_007163 [Penicillium nucicola]|uniref:uncharacterized protein n=1 Tax=Penicillium nucicola TaxID=1850975 RepID=UPI002544FD58|nr:uncharacterized protein N7511_007163 [Penicillium nucicola]KAJ5756981.1 hypothetical protein N7511_007163 [Penicillium nucicola]